MKVSSKSLLWRHSSTICSSQYPQTLLTASNNVKFSYFLLSFLGGKQLKNVKLNDKPPTAWCCHYKQKHWAKGSQHRPDLRFLFKEPRWHHHSPDYNQFNHGLKHTRPVAEVFPRIIDFNSAIFTCDNVLLSEFRFKTIDDGKWSRTTTIDSMPWRNSM